MVKIEYFLTFLLDPVADPGFLRRVHKPLKGRGANLLLDHFPPKMYENEEIWPKEGCASLALPKQMPWEILSFALSTLVDSKRQCTRYDSIKE